MLNIFLESQLNFTQCLNFDYSQEECLHIEILVENSIFVKTRFTYILEVLIFNFFWQMLILLKKLMRDLKI